MANKKKIVTLSGYINCDMDVVVNTADNEEQYDITRRGEQIIESHLKNIGVKGYAELSTPSQATQQAKRTQAWNKKRDKEDREKCKAKVKKAVAKALASKKGDR